MNSRGIIGVEARYPFPYGTLLYQSTPLVAHIGEYDMYLHDERDNKVWLILTKGTRPPGTQDNTQPRPREIECILDDSTSCWRCEPTKISFMGPADPLPEDLTAFEWWLEYKGASKDNTGDAMERLNVR